MTALGVLAAALLLHCASASSPSPPALSALRSHAAALAAHADLARPGRRLGMYGMGRILLLRVGAPEQSSGFVGRGLNDVYTLHEVDPEAGVFVQNISVDASMTGYGVTFVANRTPTVLAAGALSLSINGTFVSFAGVRAAAGTHPFTALGPATVPATALAKWDGAPPRVTSLGAASNFSCAAGRCAPAWACPAPPLLEDTGAAYVALAGAGAPLVLSSGGAASNGTVVLAGRPNCTYLGPMILANPTTLYVWASGSGCAASGLVSATPAVPTALSPYATVLGAFGGAYGVAASAASSGVRPSAWALMGSPRFPVFSIAVFVADTSPRWGGVWRFFVNPTASGWVGNATPWCPVNVTSMNTVGTGVYFIVGGSQPFYADGTLSSCSAQAVFPYALPNIAITNTSQSQYVGVSYVPITCAAGSFCARGVAETCPAGAFCPLSSYNYTLCPAGTFNPLAGASSAASCTPCSGTLTTAAPGATASSLCSICAAGFFGSPPGACSACPRGRWCPAGTPAAAAARVCGRGNYCPLGSAVPTVCAVGVGALGAAGPQGPAFIVDVAACAAHCFFSASNASGGETVIGSSC
jgi:hypothetical protein